MRPIKPRALAHRGVVEAEGFLIDCRLIPVEMARRRILLMWTPGARIYRLGEEFLLLLLAEPRRVACRRSPGVPLVRRGSTLLGMPVSPDELSALDPGADAIIFVSGGKVITYHLSNGDMVLPESWLAASEFKLIPVSTLGAPPPKPRMAAEKIEFDARARMKGVPAESPALREFLASIGPASGAETGSAGPAGPGILSAIRAEALRQMRRLGAQLRGRPHRRSRARRAAQGNSIERLGSILGTLRAAARRGLQEAAAFFRTTPSDGQVAGGGNWITSLFRSIFRTVRGIGAPAKERATGRGSTPPTRSAVPEGPSSLARFVALVKRIAERAIVQAGLGGLIGRLHGRYLGDLIRMLESGDTQEALRHAIPLGGAVEQQLRAPSFSAPRPRNSLSINPAMTVARSSISAGNDLIAHLRRLYRAMFDRLAAQGKYEEAAFVLAELLFANEEAVNFLEKHGKLQLAAEMAEARNLAPGLVVRQWFVAGNVGRAIDVARRTGAFADAVLRLERSGKKRAEPLRLLWAESLADSGDYAGAVQTVWPIESERGRSVGWMDKAIQVGGVVGARMLARKAAFVPESFPETREIAVRLLEDEGEEGVACRLEFAEAILKGDRTAQCQVLARMAARAVLRDAKLGSGTLTPSQFRGLIDFTGSSALRSDAPSLVGGWATMPREGVLPALIEVSASDVGRLRICDIGYLPDGKIILALGEAGALMINREGRTVAHFDQPAQRLVVSYRGDRAIVLASRGVATRLARIDFATRKCEPWCEARVDAFATDYDGSVWVVAAEKDLYSIDATHRGFEAHWRIPDIAGEGEVISIARSIDSCRVLTASSRDGVMEWHYKLPAMRLAGKALVDLAPQGWLTSVRRTSVSATGLVLDFSIYVRMMESGEQGEPEPVLKGFTFYSPARKGSGVQADGMEVRDLRARLFAEGALLREIPVGNPKGSSPENNPPAHPIVYGNHLVLIGSNESGAAVSLFDRRGARRLVEIHLGGSASASVACRVQESTLSIADERGRVIVLDLESGRVRRNIRM